MPPVLVRSQRVVFPDGVRPATIRVEDGRIVEVTSGTSGTLGTLIDAGSAAVMPGLVDTHVHINDPGRADWEGFETATLAASAGA
jgi:allantoinase